MKKNFCTQIGMCLALTLPLAGFGQKGDNTPAVRQPVFAGSFYPADRDALIKQLDDLFRLNKQQLRSDAVAALIVPHAGYVFSGQVAASAYAQLNPETVFSRIFIIGSSHRVSFDGASVYTSGDFSTPLGKVEVDTQLARDLIRKNSCFTDFPKAHQNEHSIEVQLPFLQFHLKKPFKLVPIIIGTQSEVTCRNIAKALRPYWSSDHLFVISSDFSHYPDYQGALRADQVTGKAIESNSPEKFLEALLHNEQEKIPDLATSCCGWSSVLTLLMLTSGEKNIRAIPVSYKNSGDSQYGEKNRVVGYHSFIFSRTSEESSDERFSLSDAEKTELLRLARQAIENQLHQRPLSEVDENKLPEQLKSRCGAFVTLRKNGQLRGCIGRFQPADPLWKVVRQMAQSAAFHDTRFRPVELNELKSIEIEISVLTPLKRIHSIDEFKLGEQGIYIIKGYRSGTFLPQVAQETGWGKEEFLGHCARDKAGLGWDGWKDAELYTYEALVFEEHEFK